MRGGEMPKRSSQCTNFNSDNKNDDFKYSKEYMLSLYKTVDLPDDIQHHEYPVTVQDQSPLSLLEKEVNRKKKKKKNYRHIFFSHLSIIIGRHSTSPITLFHLRILAKVL